MDVPDSAWNGKSSSGPRWCPNHTTSAGDEIVVSETTIESSCGVRGEMLKDEKEVTPSSPISPHSDDAHT